MAVRAMAEAADGDRCALRELRQSVDGLARIGRLHLGAVAAREGVPGLRTVEVLFACPAQELLARGHGRQPYVHDIGGGVILLPHAARKQARAAEPQAFGAPSLLAEGGGGKAERHGMPRSVA